MSTKAKLPTIMTNDKDLLLLQTQWQTVLNPILSVPMNNGLLLPSIALVNGLNQIPHRLGRKLQGWSVIRMRGVFRQIYDTQDTERLPELMLSLNSNGSCVVDLYVF